MGWGHSIYYTHCVLAALSIVYSIYCACAGWTGGLALSTSKAVTQTTRKPQRPPRRSREENRQGNPRETRRRVDRKHAGTKQSRRGEHAHPSPGTSAAPNNTRKPGNTATQEPARKPRRKPAGKPQGNPHNAAQPPGAGRPGSERGAFYEEVCGGFVSLACEAVHPLPRALLAFPVY